MRTQKLQLTFSTDTHIHTDLATPRTSVPIVSIETHIHIIHCEIGWTCDVFIDQQHNRCDNVFLLASSTRNEGASKETGAREPAIRFRGNDTPSALIRRPNEGEGK